MGFGQIYLWGVISKRVVVVVIVVIIVVVVVPEGVVIIIIAVIVAIVVIPAASIIIVVSWFTPTILFHVAFPSAIITISIYLSFRSPITLVRPSLLVVLLTPVILSRWVCLIG